MKTYRKPFKKYVAPVIEKKPLDLTGVVFSTYQLAIFAWFRGETSFRNLVVQAFAGTGKTFTIFAGILKHAREASILYLVFNKKNQLEAESKCNDSRVSILTTNACGHRIIMRNWGNVRADSNCEFYRVKQCANGELEEQSKFYIVALIAKLCDLAKSTFPRIPTVEELTKLARENWIEANDKDQTQWPEKKLVSVALKSLELALNQSRFISFADQLWLPVVLGMIKPEFPLVVIDEAQDLNPVQLEFVSKIVKPDGRLCFVGDENQAIYTWRGAMPESMREIVSRFNAHVLPLPETYRCGKAIVEKAREYVPDYIAHDSNTQGEVITINCDSMLDSAQVGEAILSRVNAPLMQHALALLRKGKTPRIEGKDIERDLISIIESLDCADITQLSDKLDAWATAMIAKAGTNARAQAKVELIQDQQKTIQCLIDSCDSVQGIIARIQQIFETTKPAIVLSTVHKAKGLEWPTVYVLEETFQRSGRREQTETQAKEERNVRYVALTRAKEKLVLVS